ncbi:MAG: hypothetical protein MK198_05320 [Gracilimonas sp.]|uniref:hypothetical protein n=1 Tax=Gracilimonas sp. TaxID=1974203 RepID=UPI003752020D|nr:hypothetical protein [Gracilimonas sp.]
MPRIFKGFTLVFIITAGFLGCSTSEQITAEIEESSGIFPDWYVQSGFSADSLSFHSFATAVSSDSIIAMANAELQARVNLESYIATKLESVREQLEDTGSDIATDTDFIITLRNAHNEVQENAVPGNKSAAKEESYYRGFSQVSITKKELMGLLESGFSGKTRFWNAIKNSEALTD